MPEETKPFDPRGNVRTRSGLAVRVAFVDAKGPDGETILAVVTDEGGIDRPVFYFQSGRHRPENETSYDLVNVEPAKWVNVYRSGATTGSFVSLGNAQRAHDKRKGEGDDVLLVTILEIPDVGRAIPHHQVADHVAE